MARIGLKRAVFSPDIVPNKTTPMKPVTAAAKIKIVVKFWRFNRLFNQHLEPSISTKLRATFETNFDSERFSTLCVPLEPVLEIEIPMKNRCFTSLLFNHSDWNLKNSRSNDTKRVCAESKCAPVSYVFNNSTPFASTRRTNVTRARNFQVFGF